MMWPARAAIRAVPAHAVVPDDAVDRIEAAFSSATDLEAHIDRAFGQMDGAQPAIARFVQREVDAVSDDVAQTLGHFLGVAVHEAFTAAFGTRVRRVDEAALEVARASLECDEELRRATPDESLESDDVVAMSQPHLLAFVRTQLENVLEPDDDGAPPEIDIEAISAVYRAVLVEIMALSQSVDPPGGAVTRSQLLA
jgi:hypothetical protein